MPQYYNLINGNIITVDAHYPKATSITIQNGKIVNIDEPQSNIETIDLKGATLIPGFTDSHFHLKNFGKRLDQLQLKGVKSAQQIAEIVMAKSNELPKGAWITGFGWDQTRWPSQEFPYKALLNKIPFLARLSIARVLTVLTP